MISTTAQRHEGFDQWIHQINQICGAFNAQPLGSEFAGRIREYQSDALKLSFVDACQARLFRTPQEVAAGEGGKYFAVFQLDGTAGMAQGEDKVLLSPGDITLILVKRRQFKGITSIAAIEQQTAKLEECAFDARKVAFEGQSNIEADRTDQGTVLRQRVCLGELGVC